MKVRIVAWGGLGLAIVFMAAYLVLLASDPIPIGRGDLGWIIMLSTIALTFSATGGIILARRPENRVGWMQHRVEALGGRLTIETAPALGTCVSGRVPVRHAVPSA